MKKGKVSLLLLVTLLAGSGQDCVDNPVMGPVANTPNPTPVTPNPGTNTAPVVTPPIQDINPHIKPILPPPPNPRFSTIYRLDENGGKSTSITLPLPPILQDEPEDAVTQIWANESLYMVAPASVVERRTVSLVSFSLDNLPTTDIEKVELSLYCLPWDGSASFVSGGMLVSGWEETSLPNGQAPANGFAQWPNDDTHQPEDFTWIKMDITPPYKYWAEHGHNYGIRLSVPYDGEATRLASTRYPDPQYRPYVTVSGKYETPSFKFPLAGKYSPNRLSLRFGHLWPAEPLCIADGKTGLYHTGIDIPGSVDDSVYAVADGVVEYNTWSDKWGGYFVIRHEYVTESVYWYSYQTIYEHLLVDPSLVNNSPVKRGQEIGKLAHSLGLPNPSDIHLHFAIRNASFHPNWSIRGRLPAKVCVASDDGPEPAFPEYFSNPEKMQWE